MIRAWTGSVNPFLFGDEVLRRGARWQFDSHLARSLKARAKLVAARSRRNKVSLQPGVTQTTRYKEVYASVVAYEP